MPYVPLHVHSQSSFLDGFIDVKEYVKFCSEQGFPGCALTDHGSLASSIEFYQACEEYKINPILGCEMYVTSKYDNDSPIRDNFHLNLFAKNEKGWRELVTIYNEANLNRFYYKPRTHIDVLRKYAKNIICSTACMAGDIQQTYLKDPQNRGKMIAKIREYYEIFKEDFYFEIVLAEIKSQMDVNKEFLRLINNEFKIIPYIITTDAHYLKKSDEQYQDLLLKIQRRGFTFSSKNHFVPTEQEFRELVETNHSYISKEQLDKAFQHSLDLNKKVKINFSKWIGKVNMPEFKNELNMDNLKFFKKVLNEGLEAFFDRYEKNFGAMDEQLENVYINRAKYEYEVLSKSGSYLYLLLVRDIIKRANNLKKEIEIGKLAIGSYFFFEDKKYAIISKDHSFRTTLGEIVFTLLEADTNKIVKKHFPAQLVVNKSLEIQTGPGRGCFLPGSEVICEEGYVNIEQVKVGQNVLSGDEAFRKVLNTFEYDVNEECICIKLSTGKEIRCTKDHKISTILGWMKAEELYDGATLISPIHNFVTVVSLEKFNYKGKVYDIEVEKVHEYTISDITVHNSAAGSLVCYLIDITHIDPIRRDLLFERFVNPTRLFGGFVPELTCLSYADYKLQHNTEEDSVEKIKNLLKDVPEEHIKHIESEIRFFEKYEAEDYICFLAKNNYKEVKNLYNSWTLYYLGITTEKPMEKFKVKHAQPTFPDIDVDFSDKERAVQMMVDTYTSNKGNGLNSRRAYPVAAFGQIKCKGAIKDVAKAIDSIIDDYSKTFEEYHKNNSKLEDFSEADLSESKESWEAHQKLYRERYDFSNRKNLSFEYINSITREMDNDTTMESLDETKECELYKTTPELMNAVRALENTKKYIGTHASAVCIIPDELIDCIPLIKNGEKYIIGTNDKQACGGDYANNFGLVKNDILGLSSLRFLQETQRMIATKIEIIMEDGRKLFVDYDTEVELEDGKIIKAYELKKEDNIKNIY